MYVPLLMNNLNRSAEEKAQWLELWDGVEPDGSEELGPGQGIQYWDCPAGYFTVGVHMLMADRRGVLHNLCVQMGWQTRFLQHSSVSLCSFQIQLDGRTHGTSLSQPTSSDVTS